jgi:tetratricopeptide (TPR) repeat protein
MPHNKENPSLKLIKFLFLICLFSFVTACSTGFGFLKTNESTDPAATESTTNAKEKPEKPKLKDFDLTQDSLYDLLVAEIAAQRNQLPITLLNYIQQARITRDPEVIKRAINAAQYMKDIEAIKEIALLWSEVEPDNISAHQLLAYQYFYAKDYPAAVSRLERILELNGDPRMDSLALSAQSLSGDEKRQLLELFQDLYTRYPEHYPLPYSIAFLHKLLKEYDQGLQALAPVFELAPEFSPASVLKTNLLYETGQVEAAIKFAEEAFDTFPADHNLGRLYASLLVEAKQLDQAEKVFRRLMEKYPQAPSLKLSLGLVMLENNKIGPAKTILNELLVEGQHVNEAHFYLGRIADQQKLLDEAIAHYKKIKESNNYEAAIERISFLLAQQEKFDEMSQYLSELRTRHPDKLKMLWLLEVKLLSLSKQKDLMNASLNKAIEDLPGDEQLLYARAMNLEAKNDLEGMEQDLRKILEMQPDHAVALNALGYTLADKTLRYQEAFELIQKALSLEPENPAIQDSMGWILFKLNQPEEALYFLLKAFQSYQDGEVAAHLGEVLLKLNQKTEAYEIWGTVLSKYPEHPVLLETLQRLAPALLEQVKKQTSEPQETLPEDAGQPASSNQPDNNEFENSDTDSAETKATP